MKLRKPFRITLALAAAAASLTLVVPAMAQDADEIIVTAPYGTVTHQQSGRRSAIGARERIVRVSYPVTAADLDLRYDGDVAELERRIHLTARAACDEVDHATFGMASTTDRACIRHAVNGAMPQARDLVARTRY